MTDFLAESFKAVVGIGAWIAVLACLGFGLYGFTVLGWRPIAALAAAGFGLFITVVSFGSLALMIQNNSLLKKIAEGERQEAAGRTGPKAPARVEPRLKA